MPTTRCSRYPDTTPIRRHQLLGPHAQQHHGYRQTQFVVDLMNGTDFGGVVDPRMSRMLAPAADGLFRGVDINVAGFGAMPTTQQPFNFFGYAGHRRSSACRPLSSSTTSRRCRS